MSLKHYNLFKAESERLYPFLPDDVRASMDPEQFADDIRDMLVESGDLSSQYYRLRPTEAGEARGFSYSFMGAFDYDEDRFISASYYTTTASDDAKEYIRDLVAARYPGFGNVSEGPSA